VQQEALFLELACYPVMTPMQKWLVVRKQKEIISVAYITRHSKFFDNEVVKPVKVQVRP